MNRFEKKEIEKSINTLEEIIADYRDKEDKRYIVSTCRFVIGVLQNELYRDDFSSWQNANHLDGGYD